MFPFQIGRLLIGSVIIGVLGIYAAVGLPLDEQPVADITLTPALGTVVLNEPFVVDVIVTSEVPVNAFSGQILFDPAVLEVAQIDYNTSIADLWVEEPWYSNGDGTVTFAGGTTRSGGYTGSGSLVTITFVPRATEQVAIQLVDSHLYAHDGFGTELDLGSTIDALFTVTTLAEQAQVIVQKSQDQTIRVVPTAPQPDVNQDGTINLADVSIFMLNFLGNNPRFDFNMDGKINTADLSILLDAME